MGFALANVAGSGISALQHWRSNSLTIRTSDEIQAPQQGDRMVSHRCRGALP